jgi:GT2 family glycosyltransferase
LLAYNQAPELRRAIQALEASQHRDQLEILVLDCASSDGTSQLDVEFPAINMLRLPHHIGAGRAYNIATRTAKGEFLFFLSPGVEVQPDTVEALVSALDNDREATAACPLLTDSQGQPTPHIHRLPDPKAVAAPLAQIQPDLAEPSFVEFPSLDALLIRKQFVQAMNYFDQRYGHYWVDAELAMQVRRAGRKIRLYPGIRAVYHPGPDPLTGDSKAAADRISGAAEYAGKYGGSAFSLRLGEAFKALAGFNLPRFFAVLGGDKLDGTL